MNSDTKAGALPKIIPMPRPDKNRSTANTAIDSLSAMRLTASILRPMRNIAETRSSRLPRRSDSGARPAAPIAMPTSAALNNGPSAPRASPHSLATLGAATDMATTSTPSARLRRKQRATTNHMRGATGPSSMRALTNSALIAHPSAAVKRAMPRPSRADVTC